MKNYIIIIALSLMQVTYAQIKIGFEQSNQLFDFSSSTIELTLKVAKSEKFKGNGPIFLRLNCDKANTKAFTNIHKDFPMDITLHLDEMADKKKIYIAIDQKLLKDVKYATFTLEKRNSKSKIDLESNNHTVIFIQKQKSSLNNKKKYNFYIGTNFDLTDKLTLNSFYSEIDILIPNVYHRLGLHGGIYKNNSVSTLNERARDIPIARIVENSITADSISLQVSKFTSIPKVSYENLGLYFDIIYSINNPEEDRKENFSIFASFHTELIERREDYTYENKELFPITTTTTISLDSLAQNPGLQRAITSYDKHSRKYYSSYFGIGLPMLYKNKNIQSYFHPTFGVGSPGIFIKGSNTNFRYYLSMQFYLMENKYGIKLSGDVRKYSGFYQDPIITINLSKSFNLTNIFSNNSPN